MRNYLIAGIITLFSGTAFAGIPAASQPAGSAGIAQGADINGDDGVFKTLQSTGTAPSLTATGAVFTGSVTVTGAFGVATDTFVVTGGQIGFGDSAPASAFYFVSPDNAGGPDLKYFSANKSQGIGIGHSKLVSLGTNQNFFIVPDGTGKVGLGAVSAPGSMLGINGGLSVGSYYGNAAPTNGAIISGDTGIGTASPASKLDVSGDAQFGSGVTKSTITAAGYYRNPSLTIAQLLAVTPGAVGETAFCNNCSPAKMVVSTGTSAGNFASIDGGAFQ